MLDTMKTINFEICKELNKTMTNLHIHNFISLDLENPFNKKRNEILTWTITGLNITNVTFDEVSSHFMLIEPTQRVKLFFNNVRFHVNFTSNFSFVDGSILNYTEVTDVQVRFDNINSITMFLFFEVNPGTKKLNATLEKVMMVADHNRMQFEIINGDGMFIHQVRNFFNTSKEYVSRHINELLQNFRYDIQKIVDVVLEEFETKYIEKYDETKNQVQALANFSMIPVGDGQQFSPIIYENYLSLQSYGQFEFVDAKGMPI